MVSLQMNHLNPSRYLEIHEDTHIYQFINTYVQLIEKNNLPLEKIYPITVGCNSLVVCGTGDGQFIKYLIDILKPYSLIIAVTIGVNLFQLSYVDWIEIWNRFSSEDKNIQILKVNDKTEILAKVKSRLFYHLNLLMYTLILVHLRIKKFS